MKKVFVFFLTALIFCPFLSGSERFFSVIDGKTGLSQNNIKSIFQDSYGFMWFGTRNRLNRYDGVSYKVFDCYDPIAKRGNNNISALFEDLDRNLWIGTDEGVYIFNPVTEKFSFFNQRTEEGAVITHWVSDIQADQDNNIWIIIPNQGAFKYNQTTKKFNLHTVVSNLKPSVSNPQCMAVEKNGRVWIGTNGSGIFLYNKTDDSFTQYLGDAAKTNTLEGHDIYTICHYEDDIYVGIHEGKLMKLNKRRNILSDIPFTDVNYKIIRDIVLINDNEIWVGTEAGLYVINEKKQTMEHICEDPLNKYSVPDNFIEKIYQDKEGGIWVGTYFGGAGYLSVINNSFEKFIPLSKKNSIDSKRIREMKEDKKGNIWIATEDAGIQMYNPNQGTFRHFDDFYYKKTLGLLVQDSKLWVGYFKNGLDIINLQNNSVQHYSDKELGLDETSVNTICEDRFGKVWLGNGWGIFVAQKDDMKFKRMDEFGLIFPFDIMEDSEGYIWVATMGNGVFQYDQEKGTLKHFIANGRENSLSSNSVSSITEDHLGHLWFSTDRGGVSVYNKRTNAFSSYSIADGLPDNVVYKVLEDKQHNMWFGTNKGLVKFNPDSKSIRVYTRNDGLMSDQFNYKSGLASSSGKLYFGNLEGLIAFNPEDFRENQYIPPVYITKLMIHNKEVTSDSEDTPLKKSILFTKKIILDHSQSTVSFDFVALSYTAPMANTYMYKMENIDQEWITTQNNHSASYAKLPPGNYVFRVKGTNNDGQGNDRETYLEITVLPPWWRSAGAYFLYFCAVLSIIFFMGKYSLKKYKKRNSEKQQLFQVEKEKELYEAKVSFFTEIAHEIRTPVTLINGPLETLTEMNIQDSKITNNLAIIEQNTKHLLSLINQLLDFRKVDSRKFILSPREVNITALVKDTLTGFRQASCKDKKAEIHIPAEPIFANVDREAMTKILNNLFSNAEKYSSESIEIFLESDGNYFTLQISNDGELVPQDLKDKIFEPFYRVGSQNKDMTGSGIGLSLTRSLVELHNGYLFYDTRGDLNTFTLKIPLNNSPEMIIPDDQEQEPEKFGDEKTEQEQNLHAETILVVEDNISMLDFIVNKLQESYNVKKAINGAEAKRILENENIDIVVSDIMMPEMNGFELCDYIKSNIEYSHILVILLTARNDLQSKIQGLEAGADAYVEKPFSFQYLQTLLSSLLNNRKREKELFLRKPFVPIRQVGLSKADEQFMNKVIEVINENITDSNFGVEGLAESVCMSRSSLHRKLKATINLSPIDFIRFVRLQKAAQLIKEGEYRIGEVCYLVGINSPSYFIKVFQKQFGMTPKEFEKQEQHLG